MADTEGLVQHTEFKAVASSTVTSPSSFDLPMDPSHFEQHLHLAYILKQGFSLTMQTNCCSMHSSNARCSDAKSLAAIQRPSSGKLRPQLAF